MELSKVMNEISSNPSALATVLDTLSQNGSLPNIPTPTMGGEVFWNTLAEANGWRLQQNMLTQHCRILDEDNVRRAWGTRTAMLKTLEIFYQGMNRYQ